MINKHPICTKPPMGQKPKNLEMEETGTQLITGTKH